MVILSLGGNIGNSMGYFRGALAMLEERGFRVERISSPFCNPAVGCEEGAADFTNIAVIGQWPGSALELLELCQQAESAHGRPAEHPHWHSRTVDVDIIWCNGEVMDTQRLTIPHPRWRERSFVTIPLAEICPNYREILEP